MEDFSLNMQQPVSAMDIDPDGKNIIAGGREFLKLIYLDFKRKNKQLEIKLNLRKQGTKHAIGYLEFNKIKKNIFLAGSLMGSFSVWDIQGHGLQKFVIKEHEAAIHRMNWSPRNENVLISGGHDGLINIYDLGADPYHVQSIHRKSGDAVRDVKFNPFNPDYFLAASEGGNFELYDIRQTDKPVLTRTAHKNLYCLDWNRKYQNVLVSGTTEKELRVWTLNNSHTEFEERVKIQLIDGSAQVKWHYNQPNLISVASLNRDISVTTYDMFQPFRPYILVKGQKDLITSFVFNNDESAIITGAKDGTIMMQPLDKCLDLYSTCPRSPVTFNQYGTIVFNLEPITNPECENLQEKKSSNVSDLVEQSFQDLGSQSLSKLSAQSKIQVKTTNLNSELQKISAGAVQARPKKQDQTMKRFNSQAISDPSIISSSLKREHDHLFNANKNVWNPRTVTVIRNVNQLQHKPNKHKQLGIEDEIKYLHLNYQQRKSEEMTAIVNKDVAESIHKHEVAFFWGCLLHLIREYNSLTQSDNNKKSSSPDLIDEARTPTGEKKEQSEIYIRPSNSSQAVTQTKKKETNTKQRLDLQRLYKYFEKYPQALRQEIENQNIAIFEKQIRIKKERVPYYQELLMSSNPINQLIDRDALITIIQNSCHDLIQDIIDRGELQSGLFMFLAIKNLNIIPEEKIKYWTRSYIRNYFMFKFLDLLESFQLFSLTVKVIQDCPIQEIRQSNKFEFDARCVSCDATEKGEYEKCFCNKCFSQTLCSLCLLPIKGLLIWCQICQHAAHVKEMYKWFENNDECPAGCGHKCFLAKKLGVGQ